MFKKWDGLDNKAKISALACVALVIGVLFWNPITRQAILFILPLGSGCDDIVFIFATTVGVVLLIVRALAGKKNI